jgi:hypothetical protein
LNKEASVSSLLPFYFLLLPFPLKNPFTTKIFIILPYLIFIVNHLQQKETTRIPKFTGG